MVKQTLPLDTPQNLITTNPQKLVKMSTMYDETLYLQNNDHYKYFGDSMFYNDTLNDNTDVRLCSKCGVGYNKPSELAMHILLCSGRKYESKRRRFHPPIVERVTDEATPMNGADVGSVFINGADVGSVFINGVVEDEHVSQSDGSTDNGSDLILEKHADGHIFEDSQDDGRANSTLRTLANVDKTHKDILPDYNSCLDLNTEPSETVDSDASTVTLPSSPGPVKDVGKDVGSPSSTVTLPSLSGDQDLSFGENNDPPLPKGDTAPGYDQNLENDADVPNPIDMSTVQLFDDVDSVIIGTPESQKSS